MSSVFLDYIKTSLYVLSNEAIRVFRLFNNFVYILKPNISLHLAH